MNYLVSTSSEFSLEGYAKVTTLTDVIVADSSSLLVIHSFLEKDYNGLLTITDLYRNRGVYKIIYVNSNPSNEVRTLVESLGGIFEDDESYLNDLDEIETLFSFIENNELEVVDSNLPSTTTGFEVMNDFLTKFETGDSKLNDPLYLEVVNRAVSAIRGDVQLQEQRTDLIGKSVIETYSSTLEVINKLHAEAEDMRKKLEDIEATSRGMTKVETVSHYPSIVYGGSVPIVVFKELSSCRYLTSFVLAYLSHLKLIKSKRVRLLIVTPKQTTLKNRYSGMFELTKDNYKSGQAILQESMYTVTPLKMLFLEMTRHSDEIILVLDRTYEKDSIIKGKTTLFYGASSYNEVIREKLPLDKTLIPIRDIKGSLGTLKHITNFPNDVDSRLDMYERTFSELFTKIDSILGVDSF